MKYSRNEADNFVYLCIDRKRYKQFKTNPFECLAASIGFCYFMENEIWKDVKGYEGMYKISNLGNAKSLSRKGVVHERFLKPRLDTNGYQIVALYLNSIPKNKKIHQLVAIAFLNHEPCGYKLVVNHINHVRSDNRLENIEIITQRENSNQKHLKSTSQYTGVCWDKAHNKWKASIRIKSKNKHIGMFTSEIEAAKAYKNALRQL